NNKEYSGQPIDMNDMLNDNAFLGKYPDHEKVLATATTGSDGSFSFMFMNAGQKIGLIEDNAYWKSGGGDFFDQMTGQVYKVIRLRVENKYYCSPDINIKLEPYQALELGAVVSYVKSYNLKVHTQWTTSTFWDVKDGQGKELDNVKTTLIRKNAVDPVPRDEVIHPVSGAIQPFQVFPKILKTDYTKGDGTVTFRNLVQHDPDNYKDRYYVLCEPDKDKGLYIFNKKEKAYYAVFLNDKKEFPFNSLRYGNQNPNMPATQHDAYGENITWNSQLQVKTYEFLMDLYPDRPRVAGKVETVQVGTKPMSNITLMMLNNYTKTSDYNVLVRKAKTDSSGYYEFDNLDLEVGAFNTEGPTKVTGPDRTLFCFPSGFKGEARNLGNLKWGQQEIQNFQLEPDGLLTGYVIDDKGNAVAAYIQVDDLAFSSTTMQFEFNPTGNVGGSGSGGTPGGGAIGGTSGGSTGGTSGGTTGGGTGGTAGGSTGAGTTGGATGGVTSGAFTLSGVSSYQLSTGEVAQLSYANTSGSFLPTGVKQVFTIKAPSGKDRKITIIPKDPVYSSETYTVDVPKATAGSNPELKPYVVFRMQKRVQFLVAEKPTGNIHLVSNLKPVPNAEVTLKIPGGDITQTTDPRGNVFFEFENNGSSFTFDIKPTDNADLENASYTLNNVKD
ncbi:MAG TPA: hypothetical protein VK861_09055, partial [Bacteroidales bacterium]|nr:hypothetical protein [Bacteroidales bacterium]